MKLAMGVLLVALLAGCKDPHSVELDTITNFEWAPNQQQEEFGRVIVMVARGWSEWPEGYSLLGVHDHRPAHNDYPFRDSTEERQPPMSFDLGPTEYGKV